MLKSFYILFCATLCYANGGNNDWSKYGNWGNSGGNSGSSKKVDLKCGSNTLNGISIEFNDTRDALVSELPWQVSVQKKNFQGKWAHACGGVVINKNNVLTSANCVDGLASAMVRVEAGIVEAPKGGWFRRKRSYPGQQNPGLQFVQKVIAHPEYQKSTLQNNLAIISLATPFDIEKAEGKINGICLPTEVKPKSDPQLLVSGWGLFKEGDKLRPKLQLSKAYQLPAEECITKTGNTLCVVQQPIDNQCQGDLGGPLISTDGITSSLTGILSSSNGCSDSSPGYFTSIEPYVKWINDNAKETDNNWP